MAKPYTPTDGGYCFKKANVNNIYRPTENSFDFRKSGSTGIYGPQRNAFDFKKMGGPVDNDTYYAPKRTKRALGGTVPEAGGGNVTQPAMPSAPAPAVAPMTQNQMAQPGQQQMNPGQQMMNQRNQSNLPNG